jgi:phosphoribosylformimino-5-aminoimidazole carboxamide ribotide isomerase
MKLFPAIDILDKKAVRLLYGKRDNETVYGDPVEMAVKWTSLGARYIHIVDLNGAFDNSDINKDILAAIRENTDATLQLGGGIRTADKIKYCLDELGYDRVIAGSICVQSPQEVEKAAAIYKDRIVAGLDAMDGRLRIKGWVEEAPLTPLEVALRLKEYGISDIVYTDISRDGALFGINAEACEKLQRETGMNVIASGGLSGYDDIVNLAEKNIYGAIMGKALYEGRINLSEALDLCGKKE